jgi:hypothetical protein
LLNQLERETKERALDACIDRLVSGHDWHAELPSDSEARREILGLVAVASRIVEIAALQAAPAVEMKQRVWTRVTASSDLVARPGLLTRLTGFSVTYRRPENPSLVHRMLFARIPHLPPLVLDYREAS